MKRVIKKILAHFNLEVHKKRQSEKFKKEKVDRVLLPIINSKGKLWNDYVPYLTFDDFTEEEVELINDVREFTMTGPLRIVSLIRSVEYIIRNKIPGDFVECGVWKGGSMMVIAKTLLKHEITDRHLFLYDTFEGMSEPTEIDISFDEKRAGNLLDIRRAEKENGNNIWCYSSIDEVKKNLLSSGYDETKLHFVKGKVEESIPLTLPNEIALLRLDTDWYESTLHELQFLYPLLLNYGILIIDDYGQWMGQKRAVDEYIIEHKLKLFLNRIDFSSRLAIKVI